MIEKQEKSFLINETDLSIEVRDQVIADLVALVVPLEADRKSYAKQLISKKQKEIMKSKEMED